MLTHHNQDYYDAGLSAEIPKRVGDRHYAQDRVRDFWYHMNVSGQVMKDLSGVGGKRIISGGLVAQTDTDEISISEFVGYAPYEVDVIDDFSAIPPTVKQEDVEFVRILVEAIAALDLSALAIPPTWGSTNYLKVKYAETDGNTRTRAKATGTYAYEKEPSYTITCDTTAATDYEIVLASLTSADSGVTIAVSYADRTVALRIARRQVFTSSGTWIRPAGVDRVKVLCVGAGGKGGDNGGYSGAGGGGGGAVRESLLPVSGNVTVTVGATGNTSFGTFIALAGANGTNSGSPNGGAGGNAGGYGAGGGGGGAGGDVGAGGANGGAGGAGGMPGTAGSDAPPDGGTPGGVGGASGTAGTPGINTFTSFVGGASGSGMGGGGGASYGGDGGASSITNGSAGTGYGAGGGGAGYDGTTGGAGGAGLCIVEWEE